MIRGMAQLDAVKGVAQALKHLERGEAAQALRVLDKVSWADLGWPDYWRVRAEAFLLLGEARRAAKCAEEGLHEAPDNLELLVVYIRALLQAQDYHKAQEALNHASQLFPQSLELQQLAETLAQHETASHPLPPSPMEAWRQPKNRPSRKPLFDEAEARAIRRAFQTPAYKPRNRPGFVLRAFLCLLLGLGLYWLWARNPG
ncbi:tetratricopeptide repeat protein [Meiothermus ruber]|nr:tetratricopeptide repeat protein [Meiothermus ruber]GAO75171.1 putative uncharacterized protein [Meiothermus ruber H328]